ncbi:MAG: hypothetical protein ACFE7E_03855 [Candidatus Hodarchaeota archaeon]
MQENQEIQQQEEKKISMISAVSFILFCAVVIYLLQAPLNGMFPFQLLDFPNPGTRLVSPLGLYLIYWLGMAGLFLGLYYETKDRLLIGVVFFFVSLAFLFILVATL